MSADASVRSVAVAIFAKAPVAGEVKTRLIPRLGAEGAAQLQRFLMQRTLRTACAAELGPVSLWCAPDCAHPYFAACREAFGVGLRQQRGDDLGARMRDAFAQLCAQSDVLLIGTDCPALGVAELRSAADALCAGHDAVFIPAEDGGYILIGLPRPLPEPFEDIPWGTDRVMQRTRERLRAAGLTWHELPRSWDVDRPEDLDRLNALQGFEALRSA